MNDEREEPITLWMMLFYVSPLVLLISLLKDYMEV